MQQPLSLDPQTVSALNQGGLILLIFVIVLAAIVIISRQYLPWYFNVKQPAEMKLKELRVQADIAAHQEQVRETGLMRQALEQLNGVSQRLAILVEQHDEKGSAGHANILALLQIVLERQGVEPSQIQAVLQTQAASAASVEDLVRQIVSAAQKPNGEAKA